MGYRRRLTVADRPDTWDAGWEDRLSKHFAAQGAASAWDYLVRRPGHTYPELAETVASEGRFGVAPIQLERLQVRDTPDAEVPQSLRDSLARHLRAAFSHSVWGQGPYWESRAIGALASWSAMWSGRMDLGPLKHRLFEVGPPEGWNPSDGSDAFLRALVPD